MSKKSALKTVYDMVHAGSTEEELADPKLGHRIQIQFADISVQAAALLAIVLEPGLEKVAEKFLRDVMTTPVGPESAVLVLAGVALADAYRTLEGLKTVKRYYETDGDVELPDFVEHSYAPADQPEEAGDDDDDFISLIAEVFGKTPEEVKGDLDACHEAGVKSFSDVSAVLAARKSKATQGV